MKRLVCIITVLALAGALAGCSTIESIVGVSAEPEPTVQPTMAPTPEPEGMEKVFGNDITVALLGAPEDEEFMAAAEAELACMAIPSVRAASVDEANTFDAVIAGPGFEGINVPCVTLSDDGTGSISVPHEAILSLAIDAAFTYDCHEAPVRVIGLFTSQDSAAYSSYLDMEAQGKFQNKGAYTGDGEAAKWTSDALEGITVGLLDCVFAENAELALAAYDALRTAKRNDTVEVVCAGISADVINCMGEDHFLMGAASGYDMNMLGAYAAGMLIDVLLDGSATPITALPYTLYSASLISAPEESGETAAPEWLVPHAHQSEIDYLAGYAAKND